MQIFYSKFAHFLVERPHFRVLNDLRSLTVVNVVAASFWTPWFSLVVCSCNFLGCRDSLSFLTRNRIDCFPTETDIA